MEIIWLPGIFHALKNHRQKVKKLAAHALVIDGRKPFIRRTQRTGENDLNKRRVSDSGHNKGTICLLNGWVPRGWFFERERTNGRHLARIGWYSGLVAPISYIQVLGY